MDRMLPWIRRAGWAWALGAVLLAVLAWRVAGTADPDGGTQVTLAESSTAPADAGGTGLVVHVAGAVRKPGVYELAPSARVRQAVGRAGGPTPKAALSGINLAAPLQDGQQVVVPSSEPAGAGRAGGSGDGGGPISISSASAAELEELDGIGPTLAERIVAERQERGGFASVDDLDDVPGIGPARLEALREEVVP